MNRICEEPISQDDLIFVRKIAGTIARRLPRAAELEDLIQDGLLGLLDARGRFDPCRGFSWQTFAGHRVRGAIIDGLRQRDHVSRSQRARGDAPKIRSLSGARPRRTCRRGACTRGRWTAGESFRLPAASDPLEAAIEKDAFDDLIAGLDHRSRLILVLYFVEQLTMSEIGAALGICESRVSQIWTSVRPMLRARLCRQAGGSDQ